MDDAAPSWEVDLGAEHDIERVVLWNRSGECCDLWLTNFVVSVLYSGRAPVFSQRFFEDGTGFSDTTLGGLEIPVNASGNIVLVELLNSHPNFNPDNYILSLAEVEVFARLAGAPTITRQPLNARSSSGQSVTFTVEANGTPPFSYQWEKDEVAIAGATDPSLVVSDLSDADAGEYSVVVSNALGSVTSNFVRLDVTPPNLALCGVATQSTTFFDGSADLAIDGNFDGNVAFVTHTNLNDPLPWWEVRLAENASIETLVLWNRTDGAQGRFSSLTVSILNDARQEVFSQLLFPGGDALLDEPMVEISGIGVEGRIVRVEKDEDLNGAGLFVSLAEVEIYGDDVCTPAPPPQCPQAGQNGFADTHCGSITVVGPGDGRRGDYLVTAQGSDDSGDVVEYTFSAVLGGARRP